MTYNTSKNVIQRYHLCMKQDFTLCKCNSGKLQATAFATVCSYLLEYDILKTETYFRLRQMQKKEVFIDCAQPLPYYYMVIETLRGTVTNALTKFFMCRIVKLITQRGHVQTMRYLFLEIVNYRFQSATCSVIQMSDN